MNIDWEGLAKDLLWRNIVRDRNKMSGYYKVDTTGYEYRGCPKGSIHKGLGYLSWIRPEDYHELTWKEFCLENHLFEDLLLPDGHNCKKCKVRKKCSSCFRDNPDHERCSWWEKNLSKNETKK